jgi:hypothetical protein
MGFDFRSMRQNGFYLAGATNNIYIGLTWSTMLVELLFNLGSGPVLVQTAVVHAAGIEELKLPRSKIKHYNHINGNMNFAITFERTFTSFIKNKKSRSHKTVGIKGFLRYYFCFMTE